MAALPNVSLSATVSLLHNNLSCSGTSLACVHNSVNVGAGKLMLHSLAASSSRDGPEVVQVMSIRYLPLAFGPVLVVSSTNGTQIYSEDCTTLLTYIAINDPSTDPEVLKHHKGACVVAAVQHIVIGTGKGDLASIQAVDAGKFMALPDSVPCSPASAVADLCFSATSGSVVSAHDNGELRVWSVIPGAACTNTAVIPASAQAPVAIASLGARIMVAYGPGTICLYDAATCQIQVEISAHARWITAVSVREDLGQIASVGEDTALNVWQVDPVSGLVSLRQTSIVSDKLLTGVAFHHAGVAVTAYDSDELFQVALA